jgi:hypothetical protein
MADETRTTDNAAAAPVPPAETGQGPPALDEARGWTGWRVDGLGGAGGARVEGLYVDAGSGEGAWLLVKIGRFGRRSLLPLLDAAGAVGRVWVPYDRARIRAAPRIEAGRELTRERELELCAHFGIPDGVGRAAAIAGGSPGTITARPVP